VDIKNTGGGSSSKLKIQAVDYSSSLPWSIRRKLKSGNGKKRIYRME